MFRRTGLLPAAALVLALALTGCSSRQRVDASSAAALTKSLDRFVDTADFTKPADRRAAADMIRKVYLAGGKLNAKLPAGVPPLESLNKLLFADVVEFSRRVKERVDPTLERHPTTVPETVTERRWRNQFLIDQLGAQSAILSAKRDRARYKDLFTVDQFQFGESSFIPPQEGVPLGKDVAMFTTTFHNSAVFNVYKVGFHIVVADPALRAPLVDEEFMYDAGPDPIQVGETRQISVSCCDSFKNETINLALRTLPQNAQIQMDMVSVFDFSKKNRLENAMFSSDEALKLAATEACLEDLKSRVDTWTPETAAPACSKY